MISIQICLLLSLYHSDNALWRLRKNTDFDNARMYEDKEQLNQEGHQNIRYNFYYQNSMSDNNSLTHLLAWTNSEWRAQGNALTFYDFEQVARTPFLYNLLQRIHPSYFEALHHLALHFEDYFKQLENFLIEVEGKKMKRGFKRLFTEQQPISEIINLVLYLLLQSPHKTEFINRIFEMPVDVQTCLMVELKRVDQSLENYIEIKDILSTVEKLEEENEELKDRLKFINESSRNLQESAAETRQQNLKIEKQIHRYEHEKKIIMEELHILDMRDYIEIYKALRQENQDLGKCINEAEYRRRQMEGENFALRDRITEDCQTITSLNEEIHKLRTNYEQARDQASSLTLSCRSSFGFEDSVLRENKNLNNTTTNTRAKQSFETSCSAHSKILWELDEEGDEGNNENHCLRNYNREIMEKLENAYRAISELSDEVLQLKEEKGKLERKNTFLDKKISDIKKEQGRFMKELKKIGF